jgi:hemerythrin-like domain-containing protein
MQHDNKTIRQTKVTWEDVDRAWPDFDRFGTLSTALPSSNEWYVLSFLVPHEALRFNLLLMERAVQPAYFQPSRTWKVDRFFDWYDTIFDGPVHHHHETEEQFVFPFLESNPNIKLPARLENDHVVLLKNMNAVKDMRSEFRAAIVAHDDARLAKLAVDLRANVTELCSHMYGHLSVEEAVIADLMGKYIEEKDMQSTVEKIIRAAGIQVFMNAADMARGQYRAGGDEKLNIFLNEMPSLLAWHYHKFTKTWVDGENYAVIQSICLDSDEPPALPKKRGYWLFRYYSEEECRKLYNLPFKKATDPQ